MQPLASLLLMHAVSLQQLAEACLTHFAGCSALWSALGRPRRTSRTRLASGVHSPASHTLMLSALGAVRANALTCSIVPFGSTAG